MTPVFFASAGIAFAAVIVLAAIDPGRQGSAAPNSVAHPAAAPKEASIAAPGPSHLLPVTATGLAGAPPGSPPMRRRTASGCCWPDDD